jgi:glutathione S-transferase
MMPGNDVSLTGYEYSVYTRSLRIALAEKGVAYTYAESNPFDPADLGILKEKHPFGRVPVLRHGNFSLWETSAMLEYVQAGFDGPGLVPENAQAAARMRQVIAVMDNYAYWPLVRQVFSHAIFRPFMGEEGDQSEIKQGLAAAPLVLATLEEIADEGAILAKGQVSLAACHALPMLECFAWVPEGRDMLLKYKKLSIWLDWMGARPSASTTRPCLNPLERKGQNR